MAVLREAAGHRLKTRFAKADTDHSGNVEWEEFENALADLRVQLCFKNLGCLGSREGMADQKRPQNALMYAVETCLAKD